MTPETIELINSFWLNMMLWLIGIASLQGVGALVFLALDRSIKPRERIFPDHWYEREKKP